MRPSARLLAGALAAFAVLLVIGGAFAGLIAEVGGNWAGAAAAFDPYLLRIVRFTLWQAVLSTLLSVGPAIFVARALSRHPAFPGRRLLLALFAVPLALPAIVAALGVLALYGRAGWLAPLLGFVWGGDWPGIYGLSGILVAHVFFNMPLATRLLLESLDSVPADQWRLASQLGMGAGSGFRLIEWPAMRTALPGVAALVFMLCVTSFTIVLLLGGGPAATTLEVAIYQALRFDFDIARAVALTILQLLLTIAAVALMATFGAATTGEASISVASRRHAHVPPPERWANALLLGAVAAFVAGPLLATLLSGLAADLARLAGESSVQRATATSLALAAVSATLAVALAWSFVAARGALAARRSGRLAERAADLGPLVSLVVPPIVIGAGWFVLLRRTGGTFAAAPFMVAGVNAMMAMPFAMRALKPAHDAATARHDRLAAQLDISGWNRLRLVDWPALRRPLGVAFAFSASLSLGDLGVIALFGSESVKTLPYLLIERMGAYRTADAAGLALFLGLLCLALVLVADRLGREKP
ncbi:MAG: thiamine/thiamine pyrophosphate ABC transporter permease [Rhizobiaceae bacterium]|nr:thiamine/thiamine pyrophosphate ABC transporter permease [Rhizobiaceae bacterium]